MIGRIVQRAVRRLWVSRLLGLALVVTVVVLALDLAYPLPRLARQSESTMQGTLVVLAQDGTPLRSWPSSDGAMRHPVHLKDVSPYYIEALLHYEDNWFYWHPGVNPIALARAAWQWQRTGRIVSGGSTLTMQVARIIDPPAAAQARTMRAKLRQIARALQLELHFSKSEILTLYLNNAPMGGMIEGVEMASRAYLGKPAKDLSMAEAALLASMPQAPSRLRPDRSAQRAQAARDKVLERMLANGTWNAADVADARMERVFVPPLRAQWIAPLAAERLRQQVRHEHPNGAGDIVVNSTLDAGVQMRLEQVLLDRLGSLPEQVSIAALIVENDTLFVRGYAGSADFTDAQRAAHVDMVRGVRSPGSTLKPFLYALALDDGLIHSESLLIDAPQNFGGYAPGNFQSSFSGPVSASEALQRSLNVPAVDLLDRIGPERFSAHLRNAGLRLRMPGGAAPNLSTILGGAGTTLEELVGAYTALARSGVAGVPRLTRETPLQETRLMSAGAAFIVREILENGGRPDTPFRESSTRIAWKTGTSFGFRDAWAVAVTDRYTLGVWVGRPDGTPNPGYFGANTAAPLAKDLLAAIGDLPQKARRTPATVRAVEICWPLGVAASVTPTHECRVRRNAWTLGGTAPPTLPDRLRTSGTVEYAWIDTRRHERVRPDCSRSDITSLNRVEFARWPELLGPWIEPAMRDPEERWPWAPDCLASAPARTLRIAGLDNGTTLRAAPGQNSARLQVQVMGSDEAITWMLDGKVVNNPAAGSSSLHLNIDSPGDHALVAMDVQGHYDRVAFSMR